MQDSIIQERRCGMEAINPNFDLSVFEADAEKQLESLNDLTELNRLQISPTERITPPQVAIEMGGGIFGTLGNFSLIIGKAKSRKSFFLNILATALLLDDSFYNVFKGCLPNDKRTILYFDTEQGKYHVQLALKRICEMTGNSNPDNIRVFCLRSKSPQERLELIEKAVYNIPNVGFVFIDGIKDLITSINDEEQATMIASKLLKWTEELNIHISVVLHQNKSDNNARGHVGTELLNKAETVLSVAKSDGNKDISIVQPEMCRNKEPESFAFEIIDGLPVVAENYEIRTETKKNKFDVFDMDMKDLYKVLTEVYSKEKQFGYSELVRQIKLTYKHLFGNNIGDNRAKDIITLSKDYELLDQEKPKAPYTLNKIDGLSNNVDDVF